MTPTNQTPSECHHCLGGIYCEAHIVEVNGSEAVDYCYGICSDYALRNEVNALVGQALDSLVADGSLVQREASVHRYIAYEIPETPCQPPV